MHGSYDLVLVFASYCVAVIASYTALYFGTRLFEIEGPARKFWLVAGAVCMGSGIWSMHFVGMSAYTMPMDMEMSFSLSLTILSWVPAVLASMLALYVISQKEVKNRSLVASAVIMGAGICAMHYGGMAAMRMNPAIQYDPLWFTFSVIISVAASGAALVICRQVRRVSADYQFWIKTVGALVMGVAICGTHYAGMEAAMYSHHSVMPADNLLRGNWMGIPMAIIAGLMLVVALLVALEDFRRIEQEKRVQEKRQQWVEDATFKDLLTGFANRQRFEQTLVKRMASGTDSFTLISLELDGYRELSSRKGETVANQLVLDAARALEKNVPPNSVISRYGQGCFIVMSFPIEQREVEDVLEGVRRAFASSQYARDYGHWSLGYVHYPIAVSNGRILVNMAREQKYKVSYVETSGAVAMA